MEAEMMREILWRAPFGYAYHKLVGREEDGFRDYIFLDVNPAFEEMTGLKRETIIGKRVTEVLCGAEPKGFDWFDFYQKVTLTGQKQEFTQYLEPLKRWYKIAAFEVHEGHFVTIIQDITEEMKMKKALEEKEHKIRDLTVELDTVFNATQDAMFVVRVENGEFRYIRNNASHQRLAGYTVSDIKGKTPSEVLGEEVGAIVKAGYQKCVEAKTPVTYEETVPFKTGERTWLTTITPVLKDGEVKYLVDLRKDITLQRQVEKEREELLRRLQAMFNEHTAVMLLIEPISGRIVDANLAACDFYGYTREELLSMHIHDINMLPKEEVARLCFMALKQKQRYSVFPHRLKSGEVRLVDVYSCPITHSQQKLLFSIIFDITDRERYKEELYREKELYKITLLSIGDGVVTTDQIGRINMLNPAAQQITGWSEDEVKGKPFDEVFELISEDTGEKIGNPVAKVLQTGEIIGLANHTVLVTREGRKVSIVDSAAPIKDMKGQTLGVVMVFRDNTQEKAWQEKIHNLSYYDSLTGLYNRCFLEEQLTRLEIPQQLPIAVITADVNGLKLINDMFGHQEGDNLLKKAADILRESCRKSDIIARWDGDEFIILLPRTTARAAEKIVERIGNRCLQENNGKTQLSLAIGYAVKKKPFDDINQVIKEAEEMMYRTKLMEEKSYRNAIINSLLSTLFAKSMETEEHAGRLKSYCLAIGRKMGLSSKELDELALLAVLHDIGKVGIKENILQKPGPLTVEEWMEMKKHPEICWRIAKNVSELAHIAEYILYHHERWDGQGYPRGLKGREIPLLCRILAVADAYDAMTSDRSYRRAMSPEKAIAEIKRNAGTQFDPQVVDIFLNAMAKGNVREL